MVVTSQYSLYWKETWPLPWVHLLAAVDGILLAEPSGRCLTSNLWNMSTADSLLLVTSANGRGRERIQNKRWSLNHLYFVLKYITKSAWQQIFFPNSKTNVRPLVILCCMAMRVNLLHMFQVDNILEMI